MPGTEILHTSLESKKYVTSSMKNIKDGLEQKNLKLGEVYYQLFREILSGKKNSFFYHIYIKSLLL